MKRAIVWGFSGCLTLFTWGCGSSDSAPEDVAPSGGTGGSGSDALDSVKTTKDNAPDRAASDAPDKLPGAEAPPGVPPQGCVHGFAAGGLNLTLDGEVPSVKLAVKSGKVYANEIACSDASGNEVAPESVLLLRVNGDAADNAVEWALGAGDWSRLLSLPEQVQFWLGEGKNSLRLVGSDGIDHFRHGMRNPDVVLDLIGNGQVNVIAENLAVLALDLAGGNDRLEDLAPPPAAPAAEPDPAEDDPLFVPITSLSVPLVVSGGEGNDWIVGGSGNDNLDGAAGDDTVSGLAGNDTFRVSAQGDGADILNGGPGYDEITYEQRQTQLTLNLCLSEVQLGCTGEACSCSSPSGEAGENDRLVNLEDVTGGDAGDIIQGSDGAESLSGGPGDDTLFGGGGSDVLFGQTGADIFDGGPDGDYCDGRPGEASSGCEL